MSMEKPVKLLFLHTGLFEETEAIKNIVQTSKKFDNSMFLRITSDMQESDWDDIVVAIQSCQRVVTI
ncbi:MAG: hypothetical protein CMF70_11455 [Magnetovibrio sp.]|nr:hypothetical protein [Magnetovibrio sp.]